jgi:hypothetical protein
MHLVNGHRHLYTAGVDNRLPIRGTTIHREVGLMLRTPEVSIAKAFTWQSRKGRKLQKNLQ